MRDQIKAPKDPGDTEIEIKDVTIVIYPDDNGREFAEEEEAEEKVEANGNKAGVAWNWGVQGSGEAAQESWLCD